MIIFGQTTDNKHQSGWIVELSRSEIETITGVSVGNARGFYRGAQHDLCARFEHSQELLKRLEEYRKLPNTLRTLADTLDMPMPQIEGIISPPIDAEFERTDENT